MKKAAFASIPARESGVPEPTNPEGESALARPVSCPEPPPFASQQGEGAPSAVDSERPESQELQAIRGRLELLAQTAGLLLRTEDPHAAIDGICNDVMAQLGCDFFFNYLVQEPGKRLRLNAYGGISEQAAKAVEFVDFGEAICGTVARDGQRLILCEIQRDANPRVALVKSYGAEAYCCHPLMAEGRVIGTISFGSSQRARFEAEEIELMKTVSDNVAVALQRAHAQAALSEREERFRLLVDSMPQLAWIAHGDGTPCWHNHGWEAYCGTSRGGAKPWNSEEILEASAVPRAQAAWRHSLATGTAFEMVLPLRDTSGQSRRFLVRIQPVKDAAGSLLQWLGTATDVDELKRGEEQLEARVLERTAQLRALAGELTQTEDRERRRIAKILHDDLQQLLVAAKFHVEIARLATDLRSCQETIEQLRELVNQAIRVARDLSHDLSLVVLHEEGLLAALRCLAKWMEQNHMLTVRIRCDASSVEAADENLNVALFQAVRELLLNVRKHAGVSAASIRVRHSAAGELQISVSDKGKGFDPTQQRAGAQSGFGLFSIRERLQLLGGRLEVTSSPGRGSRFRLVAPSAQGTPAPDEPYWPAVPIAEPFEARRGTAQDAKIRLLLVDDHQTMRSGLAALLGQDPELAVVGLASDGWEGVEQAARLQPDLVLMDLSMPRMDGVEATRQITRSWPHIKVLGLTMHGDAIHHDAMRHAGALDCLVKSGPSDDLIRAIFAAFPMKKPAP